MILSPSVLPPTSSPCCSLPGQAVKRAILLRTSSGRDSTTGRPLSPLPPTLPHGLHWCVPALLSRRITGIIECCFKGRAQPNGSIVWGLLTAQGHSRPSFQDSEELGAVKHYSQWLDFLGLWFFQTSGFGPPALSQPARLHTSIPDQRSTHVEG